MRLRQITIQQEQRDLAIIYVEAARHIQMRNLAYARDLISGRRFDENLERRPSRILQRPTVGIENGLKKQTIRVRHDRGDHVNQLRQASNLHAIRMAQQRINDAADYESIFQVVNL